MSETNSWQEELNGKRLKTAGWYGCIAPDGWKWIVEDCDRLLARLDPDYEIHQVKEKFGTLRYYYGSDKDYELQEIMDAVVRQAEILSSSTCEVCGNSSVMSSPDKGVKFDDSAVLKSTTNGGWLKTICNNCDTDDRYSADEL